MCNAWLMPMPVLEQRVAEIEKKRVSDADREPGHRSDNAQGFHRKLQQCCRPGIRQVCEHRVADGAGQEFHNIKSTIAMTMQDVESAVATISQRVSALEAHANKVAHARPCDFSDTSQGDRREAQCNGEERFRKQQHNGTEWNVDEGIFAREKTRSQGRSRENWTSGARGGTMLQTSWTRAMSECSNSCTPSL